MEYLLLNDIILKIMVKTLNIKIPIMKLIIKNLLFIQGLSIIILFIFCFLSYNIFEK